MSTDVFEAQKKANQEWEFEIKRHAAGKWDPQVSSLPETKLSDALREVLPIDEKANEQSSWTIVVVHDLRENRVLRSSNSVSCSTFSTQ